MSKKYRLNYPSKGVVQVLKSPKEPLTVAELKEVLYSEFPGTPDEQVQIVPDLANPIAITNLIRKQ